MCICSHSLVIVTVCSCLPAKASDALCTYQCTMHDSASLHLIMCCCRSGSHNSLAIYVLLRGLVLLIRCGNKKDASPIVRRMLALSRWKHGDTALMCIATSQLGYSWMLMPETLPTAYTNFLNYHGGKNMYHYQAVRVSHHKCAEYCLWANNRMCAAENGICSRKYSS